MRIVVVEDNSLVRENLRLLLQGESGVRAVHAFTSAEEALASQALAESDILLADIDLPGISGVELIAQAKGLNPDLNSMAYTIHEDHDVVFAAIRAGACGYVLKSSSPRELVEALRELFNGGAPMSPSVARKVLLHFQQQAPGTAGPEGSSNALSQREKEVLRLLEQGLSYKEIATRLSLSTHTVHSHIKRTYEKLQAGNRSDALRKARQRGLL